MAELIFEKRLTTGWNGASHFIVVLQPSYRSGWKKGKKETSRKVFRKEENFTRCFQLEIGDVIAKKGELPVGGLICHFTGDRWILFGYT